MIEYHEFRIFKKYYHLLDQPNNAKFNGAAYALSVKKDDLIFQKVGILDKEIYKRYNEHFFGFWTVRRIYSRKEIENARIFQIQIKTAFEPTGEECGTEYDESVACDICGSNRKQIGNLRLKKGSIPKKDISRTIAGEVIISEKFALVYKQRGLKGISFEPIILGKNKSANYHQLISSSSRIKLTDNNVVGINPFELCSMNSDSNQMSRVGYNTDFKNDICKCPRGDTLGPLLISEPYIYNSQSLDQYDFFMTEQNIGAKQGLLRPEPVYLCSQSFRKMVEEEKLSGFHFEISHIE